MGILFHKTMRHITPFILILLIYANIKLYNCSLIYKYTLYIQLIFYIIAIMGLIIHNYFRLPKIIKYISTFLLLNVGRFMGVLKAIFGKVNKTY